MAKIVSKSEAVKIQRQIDSKKAKGGSLGSLGSTLGHLDKGKPSTIKKDALKGLKLGQAKSKPTGLKYIERQLTDNQIGFINEFKFSPTRKFRADIFLIDYRIIIEYEGLVSTKSRHTTLTGYTNDCDKYNIATSLGYKVFRYTALNYKNIHDLIKELV